MLVLMLWFETVSVKNPHNSKTPQRTKPDKKIPNCLFCYFTHLQENICAWLQILQISEL